MADFAFATDVHVQFRDLDPMGHVNNVVYGWYLQEARADYFAEVIGVSLPAVPTVIARLEIEFQREISHGDDVSVHLRVPRLGRSSIPMEYEVRVGDAVAATAETVMVSFDFDAGESRPLPDEWRAAIATFEGLDDGPAA